MHTTSERIISAGEAVEWRATVAGIFVFTNGVFDVIHAGHIALLEAARDEGDVLLVGINDDESTRDLGKGRGRPVTRAGDRAMMVAALRSVDRVVLFSDPTPLPLVERLRPDVLVKGADYELEEFIGRKFVESYGGRVVRVNLVDRYSTTKILSYIKETT